MTPFRAKTVLAAEVATLLGGRTGSLMDGEIMAGEGTRITLQDPTTGEALLDYASAGPGLVAQATSSAARAQHTWKALSGAERGRRLWAIAPLLRQNAENLARLESAQTGKPVRDTRAEVARVAEMAEYWAGWSDKIEGRIIPVPSGHTVMVRREALGVVLAITPWNAPIFTAGWNVFPALAAGNAVVLKPSEFTPLTSLALGLLAEKAGLPRGLFQVIAGPGQGTGAALLAAPEIAKVVFVGGVAAGRAVATTAAARGLPTLLELGGKSANIVFDDADFASAIQGAQQAIYAGSGQSCVAGSRLLVQRSLHDRFVAALAEAQRRIRLGDPLDAATEMGPVANARQFAHVRDLLAAGTASGAVVMAAARPSALPEGGFWVPPTLLAGLSNEARPAQEEIFGPVVAAIPFDDEDEAITLANATPFGLAGAVWTRDLGRAHRVAARVRAGTFWVNGYRTIHVSVPFGGFGASGYGRSSGQEVLAELTQSKAIWIDAAQEPALGFGHKPG